MVRISHTVLKNLLLGFFFGYLAAYFQFRTWPVDELWLTATKGSDTQVLIAKYGQDASVEPLVPVEDAEDEERDGELLSMVADDGDQVSIDLREEDLSDSVDASVGFRQVFWEDVDDRYKLSEERIIQQKRAWRDGKGDRPSFFFYQPSGGWGNQRYQLIWAIIAANSMNRTLILPPIGPHSTLWHGFNKWPASALVPMARILNMNALDRVVHRGVVSYNDTVGSLKRNLPRLNILNYHKPDDTGFWSFDKIRRDFTTKEYMKYDVIFFEKDSMWCCCGVTRPFQDYYSRHVMFNTHIKQLAKRLIHETVFDPITNPNGTYNAVHVRRGDHITGDRRSPIRYYREHGLEKLDSRFPLYVATDESNTSWFKPWEAPQFKRFSRLIFWKDLKQEWVASEAKHYPAEFRGDLLGFIEIIICALARKWEGSKGSTFSAFIARARIRKELRAVNFTWPNKPEGIEH